MHPGMVATRAGMISCLFRTESLDQVILVMLNNSATSNSLSNTEPPATYRLRNIATMVCREYANRQRIDDPNFALIPQESRPGMHSIVISLILPSNRNCPQLLTMNIATRT